MSSVLEHFTNLGHTLSLKENDVIGVDAACNLCSKTIIGCPTLSCDNNHADCLNFYLHKSCAQLTTHLNYHQHNKHSLALDSTCPYRCDGCYRIADSFSYRCDDCDFDVCVVCVLEQRELHHIGHEEHTLTLMKREALFMCDACGDEAKDSSYVCIPCEFWIHEKCAMSPLIIPDTVYHDHPLHLVYSIPDMHRYFERMCAICEKLVSVNRWLYYCHKCTFFVHMNCASSTVSLENETEAEGIDDEPDLIKFPLPGEESLFDLIRNQLENIKRSPDYPEYPETIDPECAKKHPLVVREFFGEEDSDEDDDERKVLICDGCIQPITVSHLPYYACLQCGYFLHSYCANNLPPVLPAGASPFHPEHVLRLRKPIRFYSFVKCGICRFETNGFYYQCETCDIKIDIPCASMPARIKHISHKKHSLAMSLLKDSVCRPLFHYEGVFYCEICEEQVNNQLWLYHCYETDLSFHNECLHWYENIKFGGTIVVEIGNKNHTLTLVLKRRARKKSPHYICCNCGKKYKLEYFFECYGCGYLQCQKCSLQILGDC
ncbi:uncharacterized protein LOC141670603 isoform X2 [Apium graveolens]|uniref:uncharacterized protein LOC141670603 isoform X2 n=1 Tax=Apium graveolens TaxID=4045 RepID=UPI003D79D5BF